jgi:signal transduction histidine kinase
MGNFEINIFYAYFQGALLLQSVIFLLIFLKYGKKQFLYYMLYLLLLATYYAINASETLLGISGKHPAILFLLKYLNMPLVMLFNVFYLYFISAFLGLKQYRNIFLVVKLLLGIIAASFVAYIVFRFLHAPVNIIFNIVNISGLIGGFLLACMIVKQKVPYGKFIAAGILFYTTTSIASALTIMMRKSNPAVTFAETPLLYVKTGVLADMILYFIALISKWVNTEKELALSAIEAELKVSNERDRIRRDFHDEIGASLSGIAMYSHLGKEQIRTLNLTEAEKSLTIMQQTSTDIVDKLNDIVWLINPVQDTLKKLVQRLEEYAGNMAAIKNIQVKITAPEQFSTKKLSVENRRNMYLFCKEAINNAVKYSGATLLNLTVKESNHLLEISISDNGKGFDADSVKRGNGLDNMQKRATELGAAFNLQSKPGEGCSITLQVKITQ